MSQGRNLAITLIAIALLACSYVTVWRLHVESQARRVELAVDYADFMAFSRAYDYNPEQFLIALRRAGLTSLAVSEELGSAVNTSKSAILLSGQQIIDNARLSHVSEPTLARLLKAGQVKADEVYLLVYDAREIPRYRAALARHFRPQSIRRLSANVFAVRSQLDYMSSLGLGLPEAARALARNAHLLLVPRVQNDDRYGPAEIDALLASLRSDASLHTSTLIFFGQRNDVLGYPNHLADTAEAFRRYHYNFGMVETYDRAQVQKGAESLGELIPAQTTRVQAIAKTELDKLDARSVVARYLLGARERNVRVVYLRPFLHPDGDKTLEQTNVAMVHDIAAGLRDRGFLLGRATPVRDVAIPIVALFLASLAAPAMLLLLAERFGRSSPKLAIAAFTLDALLLFGGYFAHHDLLARKVIALWAALLFATAAVLAVADAFRKAPAPTPAGNIRDGFRVALVAGSVSLAGALVVVGLLSSAVLMEEIQGFTGVKAVILVPPLLALCAYLFTSSFRSDPLDANKSFSEPVRLYQALAGIALLGAAFLYVSRSGNQSDIAPSAFELSMRSGLTALLGVRPRFKEFLIGFPFMLLLPALRLEHKKMLGWLFVLAIAIGTSDIIDTFSHLHTPLLVSLVRICNGLLVGSVLGIGAIVVYRRAYSS